MLADLWSASARSAGGDWRYWHAALPAVETSSWGNPRKRSHAVQGQVAKLGRGTRLGRSVEGLRSRQGSLHRGGGSRWGAGRGRCL
eukprot:3892781-Pyramimonas_sp.AAC.1